MKDVFGRSGAMLWELRALREIVRKNLAAVKQPALILHPRNDDQADLSNTTEIQRQLGGLVDVVVLEDSYHMITLDRQRTLVVDRAVEYGQRLAAKLQPREEATPAVSQLAAE
jgi:carboxylesterase